LFFSNGAKDARNLKFYPEKAAKEEENEKRRCLIRGEGLRGKVGSGG